jgi:hypothetical protein
MAQMHVQHVARHVVAWWALTGVCAASSEPLDELTAEQLMVMPQAELVAAIIASRGESESATAVATEQPRAVAAEEAMPGGTYNSSCYDCTLSAEVLTCHCMGRGDVLPSALPAEATNLTGGWHSVGDGGTPDGGGTSQPTRVRVQPAGSGFGVLCTDGGNTGGCSSYPPPQFKDNWYTATAEMSAGAVNLSFNLRSGQQSWSGKLNGNGTCIAWDGPAPGPPPPFPPPGPAPDGPVVPPHGWVRDGVDGVQPAGTLTSISLGACTESSRHNVTNRDGFLSCTWTDKPPPRVGPLTDHDFNSSAKTCRYIHHTTFTSPRYSNDGAVLSESLLLEPRHHATLAGTWSSLGDDGTYSDITLVVVAKNASGSTDATVRDGGGDDGFAVTCTDAGPDDGCDPIIARHDTQGRTGGWHAASGSLKGTAVTVSFDNQQSNTGIADKNHTVIAWQDGSRWERKHPDQVGACCALCTAASAKGCRGWTVSSNVCSLMRSVGQHYPDPRAVSGYPLHSDAASYCTHGNDNREVPKPWADSKMYPAIACSSIEPKGSPPPPSPGDGEQQTKRTDFGRHVSHFPRAWAASTAGGQRGQAWFFYPRAWCADAPTLCASCSCQCSDAACDGTTHSLPAPCCCVAVLRCCCVVRADFLWLCLMVPVSWGRMPCRCLLPGREDY